MNKKSLYAAAKAAGMCRDGKRKLRHAKSIDELVVFFKENIIWLVEHDYPPVAVLREHYAGFYNEWAAADAKGVEFFNQEKVFVALASEGTAHYTHGKRGRVFVRHDSELTIYAENDTFVVVSVFDNARVTIRPTETAKVYVYLHGNAQVVDTPDFPQQIIIEKR